MRSPSARCDGAASARWGLQASRVQFTRSKYPSFSKLSSISPWDALDRLANMARQMDVGRVDHEPPDAILDADDAVQRMLFLFPFLLVTGQTDHFLFVFPGEFTLERHDAGRVFVVDAATGRAQFFEGNVGLCHPLPTPSMVDGVALPTDCPIMQLLLTLVRIEDAILLGASRDAARRSWPLRPEVRLFHIDPVPRHHTVPNLADRTIDCVNDPSPGRRTCRVSWHRAAGSAGRSFSCYISSRCSTRCDRRRRQISESVASRT